MTLAISTIIERIRNRNIYLIIYIIFHAFTPEIYASDLVINAIDQTIIHKKQSKALPRKIADAKHGGTISIIRIDNADHFNPFTEKGYLGSNWDLCYDSLITADYFDDGIYQPLIAKDLQLSPDRKTLTVYINPHAKFTNDAPITSMDVVASFTHLINNGQLSFQTLKDYDLSFIAISDHIFKIQSTQDINFQTILRLGQLPITQRHSLESGTTPIESGAYQIVSFRRNQHSELKKTKKYWANTLPSRLGMYQFERIKIIFMKSHFAAFEAFKRHDCDFRWEEMYENWIQLNRLAKTDSKLKVKEIPVLRPIGMNGFAFNQNHVIWKDIRMRRALNHAFNFEILNQQIFNRQYQRIESYFTNTTYATKDKNLTPQFDLLKADQLLIEQGWINSSNKRIHNKTLRPLKVRILVDKPGNEKIATIYGKNLKALGISVEIQRTNAADYLYALHNGNFDIAIFNIPILQQLPETILHQFLYSPNSPYQFGNLFGIHNDLLKEKVQALASKKDRQRLEGLQEIDRLMMRSLSFIPFWRPTHDRIAYWDSINGPNTPMQCRPKDNFKFWWSTAQQNQT